VQEVYIPFAQVIGDKVEGVDGICSRKLVSVDDQAFVFISFLAGTDRGYRGQ
jgi:hypothetical protein